MMLAFPIKKLTLLAIIVIHLSISCAAYSYSRRGSYGTSSRRGSYGRGSGRGSYGRGSVRGSSRSRDYGSRPSYSGIRPPTTTFAPCPIDENSCNGGVCLQPQFQCVNNGRCISRSRLCNGVVDCSDSSDERGCPAPPPCVSLEEFECLKNRQCVNMTERCDGKIDCDDESDELNCNEHSRECNNKEFTCKEHNRCIFRDYLCDEDEDCEDGSDENHCGNISSSSTTLTVLLTGTIETTPVSSAVTETREATPTTITTENNLITKITESIPTSTVTETSRASPVTETIPASPVTETTPATTVAETTPVTAVAERTSATTVADTTEQSCPNNYCMQNLKCIAINGQYYCNCSPSFTGEKCELKITAEQNFQGLGIAIGVSLASIIFLTVLILELVYYFKRKPFRHATALMRKTESQMPITSYSKE